MDRNLLEYARKIEASNDTGQLFELFLAAIREQSIDDAFYNLAPDHPPGDTIILSSLPGEWPKNGEADALERGEEWFNPFLSYCCATFEQTPVGIEYLPDHDYVGLGSKAFIGRAAEFGVRTGIAIPCRLVGTGSHGGFVLCSGYDRYRFEREILSVAGMLHTFCLIAHRRIEDIIERNRVQLEKRPLSARERQALALVARGMRAKEISHTLSVSEASIRLYLKNARQKLGARTKEEAIVRALNDGQLEAGGF